MMDLQQQPSWHGRRAQVHRGLVVVCSVLLLVACGPSSTSANGTGGGSSSDETGEGGDEILWTFGGGDRPVLSWPVTDHEGNVFVLVGGDAVADNEGYDVGDLQLVSLSPMGDVRWSARISSATETPRAAAVRPAVGAEQDVWVHFGDELVRVSNDGEVRWRSAGLPHPEGYVSGQYTATSLALAADGTCYVLPLLDEPDSPPLRQELRAIGPDGKERWRAGAGLAGWSGADFSQFPTETDAPLVAPDGGVFVGCDTCESGRIGLAHLDAGTGDATMMSSNAGERAHYEHLRWDGEAVWAEFDRDIWRVSPDGVAEAKDELPALVVDAGTVGVVRGTLADDGFSLRWGDETLWVDTSGLLLGKLGAAMPAVVVEPPGVLLSARTEGYPQVHGLHLVDDAGVVTWEASAIFAEKETIPAVGDGFIAYIDDGQRLVAVKAPVTGVADGPWPIIGGNPQGTRSAE